MALSTTLINNTSYDIKGGSCLKNGVGYDILNGTTLINGSSYDIEFEEVIPPEPSESEYHLMARANDGAGDWSYDQQISDNEMVGWSIGNDGIYFIRTVYDNDYNGTVVNDIQLTSSYMSIQMFKYKDGLVVLGNAEKIYGYKINLTTNRVIATKTIDVQYPQGRNHYHNQLIQQSGLIYDGNHFVFGIGYTSDTYNDAIKAAYVYMELVDFNFDNHGDGTSGIKDLWCCRQESYSNSPTCYTHMVTQMQNIDDTIFATFSARGPQTNSNVNLAIFTIDAENHTIENRQVKLQFSSYASGYVNINDISECFWNLFLLKDGVHPNYIYMIGIYHKSPALAFGTGLNIPFCCYDYENDQMIYDTFYSYTEYMQTPLGYTHAIQPKYTGDNCYFYLQQLVDNDFILGCFAYSDDMPLRSDMIFTFDLINGQLIMSENTMQMPYDDFIPDRTPYYCMGRKVGRNNLAYTALSSGSINGYGKLVKTNIYGFSETNPINVSNLTTVNLLWDRYKYTGNVIQPVIKDVIVNIYGNNLSLTTDYYDVFYPSASASGNVNLTFVFKKIFTGQYQKPFYIDPTEYTPELTSWSNLRIVFDHQNTSIPAHYYHYLQGIGLDQNNNFFEDVYTNAGKYTMIAQSAPGGGPSNYVSIKNVSNSRKRVDIHGYSIVDYPPNGLYQFVVQYGIAVQQINYSFTMAPNSG